MATATVDTLITRYLLDDSSYSKGSLRVVKNTRDIHDAQKKVRASTSDMNAGFAQFTSALKSGLTVGAAFTGTMIALGASILAASVSAATKAADFEALENSLKAVSSNAQMARKDLEDLTRIAKAPGIDIEGAVKGLVGLKFTGMDSAKAKELIIQSGNANAIAGGGRQEFESILRALKQIAGKEFLQGDELLQLSEAGVPATAWIKAAFGTADTEKLKKAGVESALVLDLLSLEMSKLNRATGGAKNQLENMTIAAEQAQISFGKGIIDGLFGTLDTFTTSLTDLTDSGVFKYFGEVIASDIGSALGYFDTGDLTEMMIQMGEAVVELSAHIRNFVVNVKESAKLMDPVYVASFGLTSSKGIANWLSGINGTGNDPTMEAERFGENARMMVEANQRASEKKRAEREKEEAERKAKLEGSRAEIELKRKDAAERIANGEVKADPVTREIADNTRRSAIASEQMLRDYQSAVFGGSELGKMGVSAREIKSIRGNSRGGTPEMNRVIEALEAWQNSIMRSGIKAQQHFTHG